MNKNTMRVDFICHQDGADCFESTVDSFPLPRPGDLVNVGTTTYKVDHICWVFEGPFEEHTTVKTRHAQVWVSP